MSTPENIKQIEEWSKAFVQAAKPEADATTADRVNMKVPKEVTLGCFSENGIDEAAVLAFGRTAGNITRALHHAATEVNIQQVKEKVKKGEDYRECAVHAEAKVGKDLIFTSTSKAERRGTVQRPDGTKVNYCKFNFGQDTMTISGGLPTELVDRQSEEMQKAVKDSKFYQPVAEKK